MGSRRHLPTRLPAYLLTAPAVLALVATGAVGCSSDSSSSSSARAASSVTAPDTRPDVSTVDWRNATYSVACRGLGGPSDQQVSVRLTNGEGTTDPVSWFGPPTRISVSLKDVVTGDLTGDGRPEAVVHLSCNPEQSNGVVDELQVFGPGAELIGTPSVPNRGGSDFPPQVKALAVSAGHITGTADEWAPTDPHCCPSRTVPFTFTWNAATSSFTAG